MTRSCEGRQAFPELEPHCGSWVVTSDSGEVRETFSREFAERMHFYGYNVETAAQYLGRINREIRNGAL